MWRTWYRLAVILVVLLFCPMSSAVAQFTNPLNGHRYFQTRCAVTATQARAYATAIGGNVVMVNDQAEQDWLQSQFGSPDSLWIGLSDAAIEGQLVWDDGSIPDFTNWAVDEPSNDELRDHAFLNTANGYWHMSEGLETRHAVIEIVPTGPITMNWPVGGKFFVDHLMCQCFDHGPGTLLRTYQCDTYTANDRDSTSMEDTNGFNGMVAGPTPVFAARAGWIVSVVENFRDDRMVCPNPDPPLGNYVVIDHGNGITSEYSHLKKNSVPFAPGDYVESGDQIGQLGSSGCSTTPQLEFRTQFNGVSFDPMRGTCNLVPPARMRVLPLPMSRLTKDVYLTTTCDGTGAPRYFFYPQHTTVGLRFKFSYCLSGSEIKIEFWQNGERYALIDTPPNTMPACHRVETFCATRPPETGPGYVRIHINGVWFRDMPYEAVATGFLPLVTTPLSLGAASMVTPIVPGEPINCHVTTLVNDAIGGQVVYRYVWRIDGQQVRDVTTAATSDTLSSRYAQHGALVECLITPAAAVRFGPSFSASARVPLPVSIDADSDGVPDFCDLCPSDPLKSVPGNCGCGVPEMSGCIPCEDGDDDGDGVCNGEDMCPGANDLLDTDGDGLPDCLDGCPTDPDKFVAGDCGCGVVDIDSDSDGVADCVDACPLDPAKVTPGQCGCGTEDSDSDGDGVADCVDGCPNDPLKTAPGDCGCGVVDLPNCGICPDGDDDNDGICNGADGCPDDPSKSAPGECGCGVTDADSDGDGIPDCIDGCPNDPLKLDPGDCGCGFPDTPDCGPCIDGDDDGDGICNIDDNCPGADDNADSDRDGTPDCLDGCPDDPNKTVPGECGCGEVDIDSDGDGVFDCLDGCPGDPLKSGPGSCGCGEVDTPDCGPCAAGDSDGDGVCDDMDVCPGGDDLLDSDGDGLPDCLDGCPFDRNKTASGICGCGESDMDSDLDGVPDCFDGCPLDPQKLQPLDCGCGVAETDSDGDGVPDCVDGCPLDADKTLPGTCGCGVIDTPTCVVCPDGDDDRDGVCNADDLCPGVDDLRDSDGDGIPDCIDGCPFDAMKTAPGMCGCGTADGDRDHDGVPDCLDECPDDPFKQVAGACGCGVLDSDTDDDGVPDCLDNCAVVFNPDQADSDGDGVGDACGIFIRQPLPATDDNDSPLPPPAALEDQTDATCGAGMCGVGGGGAMFGAMFVLQLMRRSAKVRRRDGRARSR